MDEHVQVAGQAAVEAAHLAAEQMRVIVSAPAGMSTARRWRRAGSMTGATRRGDDLAMAAATRAGGDVYELAKIDCWALRMSAAVAVWAAGDDARRRRRCLDIRGKVS